MALKEKFLSPVAGCAVLGGLSCAQKAWQVGSKVCQGCKVHSAVQRGHVLCRMQGGELLRLHFWGEGKCDLPLPHAGITAALDSAHGAAPVPSHSAGMATRPGLLSVEQRPSCCTVGQTLHVICAACVLSEWLPGLVWLLGAVYLFAADGNVQPSKTIALLPCWWVGGGGGGVA